MLPIAEPVPEVVPDEPEPLPEPYIEPHHVYARLELGSECTTEEQWRRDNEAQVITAVAAEAGVQPGQVEITYVECLPLPTRAAAAGVALIQQEQVVTSDETYYNAHIEIRIRITGAQPANQVREKIMNAFEQGKFVAAMSDQAIDYEFFRVMADPIVVAPDEEFVYSFTPSPSPSGSPGASPSLTSSPSITPSPSMEPPVLEEPPLPLDMPEAEVKAPIEIRVVLDMTYTSQPEFLRLHGADFKQTIFNVLGLTQGNPTDRIVIEGISRGAINVNLQAVKMDFVVMPPLDSHVLENAMQQKMKLDDMAADGTLAEKLRLAGVPAGAVKVISSTVAVNAAADTTKHCKRCRSGAEQAEHDQRVFTRKCNRDGKCNKELPFKIDDACARGCADHCTQSCKRFHEPKARICAARRRQHDIAKATIPAPTQGNTDEVVEVTNLMQVHADMRQTIRKSVDAQALLTLDQVSEQTEAEVIAQCFSDCAQVCVETCIGQWIDATPDPELEKEAIEKVMERGHKLSASSNALMAE